MSRTNGDVIPHEVYETPIDHITELMNFVDFREGDRFLEPCKSGGNIYNLVPLPEESKEWCEILLGRDYLTHDFGEAVFDVIITNPPFSLTREFLRKSLRELKPDGTLIYLQRLNYLGSRERVPFWREVGYPDATPILIPRPSFTGKGTDATEYCWYVYDRGGRWLGDLGMSHILTEEAKLKLSRDEQKRVKKLKVDEALSKK